MAPKTPFHAAFKRACVGFDVVDAHFFMEGAQ